MAGKAGMHLMPGSESVEGRVAALLEQQNIVEALQVLEPAIGEDPENGRLFELLGQGLAQLGRSREALDAYNTACYLLEDPSRCLTLMGTLHTKLGEYEEAVAAYRTVLSIRPEARALLASIAYARFQEGKLEESLELARRAVAEAADHSHPHYVLGLILAAEGEMEAAIASFSRALAIHPDHAQSRACLGQAQLVKGDLARGPWEAYHHRLRIEDYRPPPQHVCDLPEWEGGAIPGRLLLWEEQGIGDRLFSLRFVTRIDLPPERIVLAVEDRLVSLVRRAFPQCTVIADDDPSVQKLGVSHIFPLCSLGMHANLRGVMEGAWPCPYLFAEEALVAEMRRYLDSHGPALKVGLSWGSDPGRSHGSDKSVPLELFASLAVCDGLQLVDLQYGDTEDERRSFTERTEHELLSLPFDKRNDIEALAALIRACDLVVTVSNVTAHLAGALGVKGIVLLPGTKGLFWFWHRGRSTTPWYPSLTLLRQERPGAWEEVVGRAVEHVVQWQGRSIVSK